MLESLSCSIPAEAAALVCILGWSPSSLQVACVFTPSHSRDCQRQRDLSGRVCGEKLPILREQRKILCLEPTRPWPVASACFLVLPFPAALVSCKLKEPRSYVFCSFYEGQSLWLCTLITHIPSPLLGQCDSKWFQV